MKKSAHGPAILAALFVLGGCSSTTDDSDAQQADIASVPHGNPDGHDVGGGCASGADCKSGVCTASACAAPTCSDGVQNGAETGLDCGGSCAPCGANGKPECGASAGAKCDDGKACGSADDCTSAVCTGAICQAATSTDGVKNGSETDVDCGGGSAPACAPGLACAAGTDCDSKVCGGDAKCAAPTSSDGVQNGDESDVDCGGTKTGAPRCSTGQACNAHADCASDGCDDTKHCAIERSCTQTNGGLTCGTGEVGDAAAKHESCCTSLKIPGSATRLDKYKVTSGRMRAFIDRTNGDVQGWYNANKGSLSAAARAQIDPYVSSLPTGRTNDPYGADYQLGGTIYLTDRPSTQQGCYVGNASNQAYGSHTWWNGALEGEDRGFDQAFLDRLPLNCVPYPLVAAFCAWDGGRLQTFEENAAALGGSTYPWGNTPSAGGFAVVSGQFIMVGPATQGFSTTACPGCDASRMNWRNNYQFPEGGNAAKPWDYAYWMSAPGRFAGDMGPGGHMDVGGLLIELTASTGTDAKYGAAVRWSKQGSWEGHQIGYTGYVFAVMTKYGKTGGRCARD